MLTEIRTDLPGLYSRTGMNTEVRRRRAVEPSRLSRSGPLK